MPLPREEETKIGRVQRVERKTSSSYKKFSFAVFIRRTHDGAIEDTSLSQKKENGRVGGELMVVCMYGSRISVVLWKERKNSVRTMTQECEEKIVYNYFVTFFHLTR